MCLLSCWARGRDRIAGWGNSQEQISEPSEFGLLLSRVEVVSEICTTKGKHTSNHSTAYRSLDEKEKRSVSSYIERSPFGKRGREKKKPPTVAEIRPQSVKSPRVLGQDLSLRLQARVRIPELRRHLYQSYQPRCHLSTSAIHHPTRQKVIIPLEKRERDTTHIPPTLQTSRYSTNPSSRPARRANTTRSGHLEGELLLVLFIVIPPPPPKKKRYLGCSRLPWIPRYTYAVYQAHSQSWQV